MGFKFRDAVLSNIGLQLLQLELQDCQHVDLSTLESMTQLEVLVIGRGCTIKAPQSLHGENFLPNLKKLSSTCCLGTDTSYLLLEFKRPALIDLNLSCYHILNYGSTGSNWKDVPTRWPNLHQLSLRSAHQSLTLDIVRKIVSGLDHLYKLKLPSAILPSVQDAPVFEAELKELYGTEVQFHSTNSSLPIALCFCL